MLLSRVFGVGLLLLGLCCTQVQAQDQPEVRELFPVPAPLASGELSVDEIHTIHYMLFGNVSGQPVFVLHGGPGFGCYPRLVQYFDPAKFFIVLHDQRGSGRSTPLGELQRNTTQALLQAVAEFEPAP